MKKLLLLLSIATIVGCTSTQQRIAINTLSTTEQSVTAAVDAYDTLVIKGQLPTNDVPKISAAYNKFQAALIVAEDAVQYNTNAITPPALVVEAQDVINLINTVKGVK